jgi:hypothetical protein
MNQPVHIHPDCEGEFEWIPVSKEAVRSCYRCGGVDVFRYNVEPIVEGSDVGGFLHAASTPELAQLRYQFEQEKMKREEAEKEMKKLKNVVATLEVNFRTLGAAFGHVIEEHILPIEVALRGSAAALLPIIGGCSNSSEDGSFGVFEGVTRPRNPTPFPSNSPKSPESIRVIPGSPVPIIPFIESSSTTSISSSSSAVPSLISDDSPISVFSESEAKSLWTELNEWFQGRREGAEVSSVEENNQRSVEIVEGESGGGSDSGESSGSGSVYFADSEM